MLVHQLESGLYHRSGQAINNFALTLPKPQSDLARQTLKDPYIFDFLHMTEAYDERDLENALVSHVTQFLLELGAGFAYLGKQVLIQVGERDFYIDLLFYHTRLHCYIVTERLSLSQNTPVSSISTLKLSIVNCVVNMMNRALVS